MCNSQRIILVVDDDAAIRETLADLLTEEGYAVITAANGEDALAKLRAVDRAPCVILLDLMMPVMSGAEFYRELRGDPSLGKPPVVVISADGNVQKKAQAFDGEYLAKPVKIDPVLAKIEQHCA